MIPPGSLRLLDDDDEPASAPSPDPVPRPEPRIFVRTIAVPAGLPWDQSRAADLEARHGAPLPMAEVLCQVRRLDPWRPGISCRFAAFYVMAAEVVGRLDATVDVDGRPTPVTFLAAGEQGRRARWMLVAGLAAALVVFLLATAVGTALLRRSDAEAALSASELRVAAKLKALSARERLKAQTLALNSQPDRGARMGQVLADLAWASGAKLPDARIQSVRWEPDLLAFEVRGDSPPVQENVEWIVQRAKKPLKGGRWLWGAMRRGGELSGPVAARPKPPRADAPR